jgi:hypothetical protein
MVVPPAGGRLLSVVPAAAILSASSVLKNPGVDDEGDLQGVGPLFVRG